MAFYLGISLLLSTGFRVWDFQGFQYFSSIQRLPNLKDFSTLSILD